MNIISIITIVIVGLMSGYSIFLVNQHKNKFTTLHGIIIAMTVAAMTGFVSGDLVGILSEDLFLSCGIGIIIGFITGFLAGQPIGIMPILSGSVSGLISGVMGAVLGISIKSENPFLMLIIILVFYVIVLGLVILFSFVETNEKLTIDTQAISPFVVISAGVVCLSLFLFLYSSDIIKVSSPTATAQAQENEIASNTNTTNSTKNTVNKDTEVDVTKETSPTIKMEVTATGYSPNIIKVKKGEPVKIEVHNPLENSCLSTFNMPDFDINNVNLKVGTTNLSFTPTASGEYTFSCGMNMFGGKIIVE